ncbi:MAG TPA: AI-2E family transporter, partial [Desulfoprunum sp.]|nr:AI-2E family transporter [Desulfoprunum sp.]
TEMHDLFVLFGTLGGIAMFGLLGIIIGPIVAALFITVWEIYGDAFREHLPDVGVVLRRMKEEATEGGVEDELLVHEDQDLCAPEPPAGTGAETSAATGQKNGTA